MYSGLDVGGGKFTVGELSINPQAFGCSAAARPALGTSSPWKSKERRAVFSPTTRTVAGASYTYKLCMKGKGGGVFLMVFEVINSY